MSLTPHDVPNVFSLKRIKSNSACVINMKIGGGSVLQFVFAHVGQVVPLPGSAEAPVCSHFAQNSKSSHFGPNLQHVRRWDVLHDLPRPPPDSKKDEKLTARGWSNRSKVRQKVQWEEACEG